MNLNNSRILRVHRQWMKGERLPIQQRGAMLTDNTRESIVSIWIVVYRKRHVFNQH